MFVGSCWINLHLPGCFSLKDKRRIVKSLKDKLKSHHNISIAEIGALDSWQRTELGLACVANEKPFIDSVLNSIVESVQRDPRVLILDVKTQIY